jgi:hemolysin-activating ACP:hemolysin acyltransferase
MNSQPGGFSGAQPRSNSEVLGEILWLYAHSQIHQRLKLYEVEQFVLPAIKHGRYRIYKRNDAPIGYVGIARLAKEIEDAWLHHRYVLQPDDWVSGDRLWILQFVVPFGDVLAVRKMLWREPELFRKQIWAQRPNKNGPGVHVTQFGKYRNRDRQASGRTAIDGELHDITSEPASTERLSSGRTSIQRP